MSQLHRLFAVPLFVSKITGDKFTEIQQEIREKWDCFKEGSFSNPQGWKDGVLTNYSSIYNTIEHYDLKNLKQTILESTYSYVRSLDNRNTVYSLSQSWINITEQDQEQDWHQHKTAAISGVYYYDCCAGAGDLILASPNPFQEFELFPFDLESQDNFSRISPEIGKIVLFPGWVKHKVEKNANISKRISIAFNLI